MSNHFKVQIPQSIVRGDKLNDKEFVLLARLIQTYYSQTEKNLTFTVNYKALIHHTVLKTNKKLNECLKTLHNEGIITNPLMPLSKNGQLTITLSGKVIPELNENQLFVQFESWLLYRSVIEYIGHTGVRILYHIMSYINYKQKGKDHCYASIERMSNDMGMSDKTFRKYINKLEKARFIKVKRHDPTTDYYINKNGVEGLLYDRWNNHYFIKKENIEKFIDKNNEIMS